MQKTILQTATVNKPKGAYSHGVKATGKTTIYIGGQAALNAQGELVGKGDMRAQVRQVYEKLKAILEAGGATFDNVVKTTTYVTDMEEYLKASDIRREYYPKGDFPASMTVSVTRLTREEYMLEVEAIAVL